MYVRFYIIIRTSWVLLSGKMSERRCCRCDTKKKNVYPNTKRLQNSIYDTQMTNVDIMLHAVKNEILTDLHKHVTHSYTTRIFN